MKTAMDNPTIWLPETVDETRRALHRVMQSVPDDGYLAVDVETTGTTWSDTTRTVQLGSPTHAVVVVVEDSGASSDEEEVELEAHLKANAAENVDVLRRFFAHVLDKTTLKFTAHNGQFDARFLHKLGVVDGATLLERLEDTMILAALIDSPRSTSAGEFMSAPLREESKRGLKELSAQWLDHSFSAAAKEEMDAHWKALGFRGSSGWSRTLLSDPVFVRYAGSDVIDGARLAQTLAPFARASVGQDVIDRESKLQAMMFRPHVHGYHLDLSFTANNGDGVDADAMLAELQQLGVENPNATADVAAAIEAEGFTLPTSDTGKPSTAKNALKMLTDSVVAKKVLAYRAVTKEESTYGSSWTKHADDRGRIHPVTHTLRAATGRFSMSEPSLQNVPSTARGYLVADPGCVLVAADFSAIEVRVGAGLAQEPNLIADLRAGHDPYSLVAAQAYGENFTKADRNACKPILLGRMYGRSAASLAREERTRNPNADEAAIQANADRIMKQVIDQKWRRLSYASRDIAGRVKLGETRWTLPSGRVVSIDPTNARNAFNALVQGSARELLVDAGMKLADNGYRDNIWLSIHDEWIVQVPAEDAERVRDEMEQIMTLEIQGVPFKAEATVLGERWRKG